ncbi:hypothetical protein ABENE_14810 [Asticcacaulis benevestitus DSM 16100 = ATCC BAA-896]|uniref:Uncharacterized protein n=1 Tax=Asticcacaulis benevestitus DSM 16100 = ATCC BAA-896 TaxID=1121022 RepID=V4PU53_9CAUL|nr:hypothetical protein ABENE_14810 [Asticcacaulis benevestitus DSM 16100 = ATCC BAA-896]
MIGDSFEHEIVVLQRTKMTLKSLLRRNFIRKSGCVSDKLQTGLTLSITSSDKLIFKSLFV